MSFTEWLARDGVTVTPSPRDLTLTSEGLWTCRAGLHTFAPWSCVLAAARIGATLYVLVPRRPPKPPWIEVSEKRAREAGTTVEELAAGIEARLSHEGGYRDAVEKRSLLRPEQLLEGLVADDPVPGTVEVPVGPGPDHQKTLVERVFTTALGGGIGIFGGVYGGMLLTAIVGPVAWAFPAAMVAGAAAGAIGIWRLTEPRRSTGRVLALAPDGCVVGLPDGVRVWAWADLGPFETKSRSVWKGMVRREEAHLVILDGDGRELGAMHHSWFSRPLALIVEIAEAYRQRFSR